MVTKKIIKVTGVVKTMSGVRINGADVEIGPGGADNCIVRNAIDGQPYIPGSSVKGKVRSLLEEKYGRFDKNGRDAGANPCGCGKPTCMICKCFGAHNNVNAKSGIPRFEFNDMTITDEFRGRDDIIEITAATSINRQTGTAANGSLRQLEQISRGVEFNYSFNIRVTDEDDADKLKAFLIEGLTKLEDSGIGSGNSRGVGRIKFLTREIEEIDY